jgi:hypothetical protein
VVISDLSNSLFEEGRRQAYQQGKIADSMLLQLAEKNEQSANSSDAIFASSFKLIDILGNLCWMLTKAIYYVHSDTVPLI